MDINLKITKEISLTPQEVKDIIIKYLNMNYNITGNFDVQFPLSKRIYPSDNPYDTYYIQEFSGAIVRINEDE